MNQGCAFFPVHSTALCLSSTGGLPDLQYGGVLGIESVPTLEELACVLHLAHVPLEQPPRQVHIPRPVVHLQALPEQVPDCALFSLRLKITAI